MKYKDEPLPGHRPVTLTLERGASEDGKDNVVLHIRPQQPADEDKAAKLWPQPQRPKRLVLNAKQNALRDPNSKEVLLESDGATPPKLKLAEDRLNAFGYWCVLKDDPNLVFDTPVELLEKEPDAWADAIHKELEAEFTAGELMMIQAKNVEASGLLRANAMLDKAQKSFSEGDT